MASLKLVLVDCYKGSRLVARPREVDKAMWPRGVRGKKCVRLEGGRKGGSGEMKKKR